jgi:hypothetical protein
MASYFFLSPGVLDLDGFILLPLTWIAGPGRLHTPSSHLETEPEWLHTPSSHLETWIWMASYPSSHLETRTWTASYSFLSPGVLDLDGFILLPLAADEALLLRIHFLNRQSEHQLNPASLTGGSIIQVTGLN